VSAYAAWHQVVPICTEWWCTEANEATQTHCCNPVAPGYLIWAYYAHGRQCRCQEDPVGPPPADWRRQLGRPRITWLSTIQQDLKHHHLTLPEAADLAQNRPLWSPHDVDVWRYATVSCLPETTTTMLCAEALCFRHVLPSVPCHRAGRKSKCITHVIGGLA